MLDDVLNDWQQADIDERLRAGLRLLEALTIHPQDINGELVESLRSDGLDDEALEDAANVGFHFNLLNRLADALDFPRPNPDQLTAQAKMLDRIGKRHSGVRPVPSWTKGVDGCFRPVELEIGRTAMLSVDGQTKPALRRAVDAFVVRKRGGQRNIQEVVPDWLDPYLTKLSTAAYRITDQDVEDLRQRQLNDEAIFELTLVGANAAALWGLERLFGVLHGADLERSRSTAGER